ncbi:MAG: hypothetical protein VKJ24_02910 [Synechococcales bacterium]|nr:hypothetical protein [Synechococcales bacterium]
MKDDQRLSTNQSRWTKLVQRLFHYGFLFCLGCGLFAFISTLFGYLHWLQFLGSVLSRIGTRLVALVLGVSAIAATVEANRDR